ncbi:MAG: carbohydrate binding family 9 domain-containing protein [Gammaproteobacteria bacterium]|nr:carbohydrate binding family 9 domain-containing protein [Gammaproteobacteria bacterium]
MSSKPFATQVSKLTSLVCAGLFAFSANAAQPDLTIPKTQGKITVDGELNEPFWQQATKVELGVETRPGENVAAKAKTTAYIIENGDSLLVALVAEDPDPSKIQASLKDRDRVWADDLLGFKVDTFNDKRKAYNFFVNPLGIQMDSIEDDVSGNEDGSWNAIWYSEGKITDTGYQVEIEIPFKVLRFPDNAGQKTWGVDFIRMYPRDYHYRFAYNSVERDKSCFVCQIGNISGFENIESGQNLEVTPYVSAQRIDSRDPSIGQDWQEGDFDFDGGVDLRWGVTDNSVLNATINPDFSQVEADAVQLDVNTTFALFFQERRPFFIEGSDYFRTSSFNLLHTRNIADPDWGLKYTGKNGKHSYGILTANDNVTTYLMPGTQSSSLNPNSNFESDAFVARYAYDMGDKSQIGGMVTHRSGENYENTVASIDGKYYFSDEDVLRYQAVYSDSTDPEVVLNANDEYVFTGNQEASNSGNGYALSYNHNGRNWNWRASRTDFTEDFRADLGFMNQVGVSRDLIGLGHTWHAENGDTFDRIHIGGDIDQTKDYTGQKLEEEAEFWVNVNGPYQSWFGFGSGVRDAWYSNETVNIDDGNCPRDTGGCWFDQNFYWVSGNFRPVTSVQLGVNYNGGDAIDFISGLEAAKRRNYGVWGNWQVTQSWYFSADYHVSKLWRDEGDVFKSDVVNINSTYQFDKQQYLRLTIRYSDVDFNQNLSSLADSSDFKQMGRQLLYAYKLNPRTVFFLGYSDGGFEDNTVSSFERSGRAIFSKFSYAFQL